MKHLKIIPLIAGIFMLALSQEASAQLATVSVLIKNIQPGKGNVVINLYDSKENWFKKEFMKKTVLANLSSLTVFLEIPKGTYGIAIFQDLDSDGKLKYGMFSVPKEPVALGNNFKPRFSSPAFIDCAILIKRDTSISLTLY